MASLTFSIALTSVLLSYRAPGLHIPVVDKQFRPDFVDEPRKVLTLETVLPLNPGTQVSSVQILKACWCNYFFW